MILLFSSDCIPYLSIGPSISFRISVRDFNNIVRTNPQDMFIISCMVNLAKCQTVLDNGFAKVLIVCNDMGCIMEFFMS